MSKYDTVLFDLDGTVVDSTDAVIQAWQHTYKELTGSFGDEDEILATFGEQLDMSMAKKFPAVPVETSTRIYREYQTSRLADLVHPFPDVLEAISEIKSSGPKLGLVTSRHADTANIIFDLFGLRELFDVIIMSEDTEHHKPHPAPCDKALLLLDSDPEYAVMIGDSTYDLLCAHNAGVDFALVSWTSTYEIVRDEEGNITDAKTDVTTDEPEYIVDGPNEIIELL